MGEPTSDRYLIVSTDGHCGADLWDYKPYLASKYHDDFDAWAASYHDAWDDIDAALKSGDTRIGISSGDTPLNWESQRRLQLTESQGIAAEVLFPNTSPPFIPSGAITAPGPRSREDFEYRFAGLQAHNRWLVDFCIDAPGRRAGFAQIFLDDVDAAIKEATWAKSAGLMGVLLPNDHVLRMANLYYPAYDPFWAACADLDLPVHRHSVFPCENAVEGGYGSQWVGVLEIWFYGLRAISHLICAGVFERYPRLKFVTTELGNGAHVPGYLARLDAMWMSGQEEGRGFHPLAREAVLQLSRKPSEYFATNCYIGGPLDLRDAYFAGTPNLMFGADLPHSEGTTPYTTEALRVLFANVPEPDVRAILGTRAADVYGFDLAAMQAVADRIGPTVEKIATPFPPEEWPAYPTESFCRVFTTTPDLRGL